MQVGCVCVCVFVRSQKERAVKETRGPRSLECATVPSKVSCMKVKDSSRRDRQGFRQKKYKRDKRSSLSRDRNTGEQGKCITSTRETPRDTKPLMGWDRSHP